MEIYMKSLFKALILITYFLSFMTHGNDSQFLFSKYRNAIIPSSEGNIGENPQEIAQNLINGDTADLGSVESIVKKIKTLPNY